MDSSSHASNIFILVDILVLLELLDKGLKFIDLSQELTLVTNHLLEELLLFFFQVRLLLVYLFHCFLWSTIHSPFLIVVIVICELVVELVQDLVNVHTVLNLWRDLLNFIGNCSHI